MIGIALAIAGALGLAYGAVKVANGRKANRLDPESGTVKASNATGYTPQSTYESKPRVARADSTSINAIREELVDIPLKGAPDGRPAPAFKAGQRVNTGASGYGDENGYLVIKKTEYRSDGWWYYFGEDAPEKWLSELRLKSYNANS